MPQIKAFFPSMPEEKPLAASYEALNSRASPLDSRFLDLNNLSELDG